MTGKGKKQLILIPSTAMDKNKKSDRNENGLVRMSATVRNNLQFGGDKVEVWTAGGGSRSDSVMLDIFKALPPEDGMSLVWEQLRQYVDG